MQEDNIVPGEGPHANSASAEEFPWALFQYPTLADHANELRRKALAGEIRFGDDKAPLGKIICGEPMPIGDLRAALRSDVATFVQAVIDHYAEPPELRSWFAPAYACAPDTGSGKSKEFAEASVILTPHVPGKIIFTAPTLSLAQELTARIAAAGGDVMLWAGRSAELNGIKMCEDYERIDATLPYELVLQETCCVKEVEAVGKDGKPVKKKIYCPFFDGCAYQGQLKAVEDAKIVVMTHKMLSLPVPEQFGEIGLLIIDEKFYSSMLDEVRHIALADLDPMHVTCYDAGGLTHERDTKWLRLARAVLLNALGAFTDEDLNRGLSLRKLMSARMPNGGSGLTAYIFDHAAKLERMRIPPTLVDPATDLEERVMLMQRDKLKSSVYAGIRLWESLAAALERGQDAGDVRLVKDGDRLALRIQTKTPIRKGWTMDGRVPVAHLDATMQIDLVRAFLPQMPEPIVLRAQMPHVTITQYEGVPQTLGKLLDTEASDDPEEAKEFKTELLRLHSFILGRAKEYKGKGRDGIDLLVVAQKAVSDALKEIGLPQRVEVAHFNAIAGIDRWGGVRGLVVIGRVIARSGDVELIASALDGIHREPIDPPSKENGGKPYRYAGWEQKRKKGDLGNYRAPVVHMDWSCHEVNANFHPDPLSNSIAQSITVGELLQVAGRVRGVNRTADAPVHIDLLTEVALPLQIDASIAWNRRAVMAAHGVVLDSPSDRAFVFKDLWVDAKAATNDRFATKEPSLMDRAGIPAEEQKGPDCSLMALKKRYYKGIREQSDGKLALRYKVEGRGKPWRYAEFNTAVIADPEHWVRAHFGNVTIELIGWAE